MTIAVRGAAWHPSHSLRQSNTAFSGEIAALHIRLSMCTLPLRSVAALSPF
jgi:hypothetical protein